MNDTYQSMKMILPNVNYYSYDIQLVFKNISFLHKTHARADALLLIHSLSLTHTHSLLLTSTHLLTRYDLLPLTLRKLLTHLLESMLKRSEAKAVRQCASQS